MKHLFWFVLAAIIAAIGGFLGMFAQPAGWAIIIAVVLALCGIGIYQLARGHGPT